MNVSRPEIPVAGIVYGEVVYWLTVLGSVIAIIGATAAMFGADNYLDPSQVFSAIWEGQTTVDIWEGTVGAVPRGHWYLPRLGAGDALAMFGLAVGVFSVIPALIASAIALFRKRQLLFGALAIVAAVLCITSCLGVIELPS
jgi:hypothetical protein